VTDYQQIFQKFKGEEADLIPILQRVQESEGFISENSVQEIAEYLKISENQIYGVVTFYSKFKFTHPGRHSIKVCEGSACHMQGGRILSEAVERVYAIEAGETTEDQRFDLSRCSCMGCCSIAPAVSIDDKVYSQITVSQLMKILDEYE
jgi:NADH-quinone oxidoreductase subunit E